MLSYVWAGRSSRPWSVVLPHHFNSEVPSLAFRPPHNFNLRCSVRGWVFSVDTPLAAIPNGSRGSLTYEYPVAGGVALVVFPAALFGCLDCGFAIRWFRPENKKENLIRRVNAVHYCPDYVDFAIKVFSSSNFFDRVLRHDPKELRGEVSSGLLEVPWFSCRPGDPQ